MSPPTCACSPPAEREKAVRIVVPGAAGGEKPRSGVGRIEARVQGVPRTIQMARGCLPFCGSSSLVRFPGRARRRCRRCLSPCAGRQQNDGCGAGSDESAAADVSIEHCCPHVAAEAYSTAVSSHKRPFERSCSSGKRNTHHVRDPMTPSAPHASSAPQHVVGRSQPPRPAGSGNSTAVLPVWIL